MTHKNMADNRGDQGGRAGSAAGRPGFLRLPPRTVKPRQRGISHVLDNGLSLREAEDRLAAAAPSVDVWKFGWGTAYLDAQLEPKLAALAGHEVMACTGGTLLEVAWLQHAVEPFLQWAGAAGFPAVEVSAGTVEMTRAEKSRLIEQAAAGFVVLAEVGRKDPSAVAAPDDWADQARADREAGARWVVTEGRESGTVGLFTAEGEARADVVDAIVGSIGIDAVLFEAPRRAQQAWLIHRFGPDVNLGNVNLGEALALEALRLGLRADTVDLTGTPGQGASS